MAAGRGSVGTKRPSMPMKKKKRATQSRGFYILLAAVAVAGAVAIGTVMTRPKASAIRDVDVSASQAEGYLLGDSLAPVQVMEFADFECPACGQFAVLTEPDIRHRLIESGQIGYRFFDFPLPGHHNTMPASMAAACASDQGKFWPMHDAIFFNQPEWSTAATSNPGRFFIDYARQIGLDIGVYKKCMDEQPHQVRIIANRKEGERRGVAQTPSFIIGRKLVAGAIGYDEFRALVDSAKAALPPVPLAAPAPKTP